jgi:competence protein ComEA
MLLRWSDQACCVGLIAVALGVMGATWAYQGGLRGRLIDIERAPPVSVRFQVDMNRAEWPEWSALPGIGEQLARRIVNTRAERKGFLRHEDLLHVPGIGPRTLERVRPYLLPVGVQLADEGSANGGRIEDRQARSPVSAAGSVP